jgi:hypothetical protein
MEGLEGLFDSVNIAAWKDDLMEFGLMAGGAIGATVAWGYVDKMLADHVSFLPGWGRSLVALVGGVAAFRMASRYNRPIAMGLGVGFTTVAIRGMLKQFAPDIATRIGLQGLGEDDPFARYLDAAPLTIEEESTMNGFDNAPTTIEESVAGLHGFEAALA